MATPRQNVQVGIFLAVCGVLLVSALVLISDWQREETVPYFVIFDESVSGLFPGSDVRYRGVPVGRVTAIKVIPSNLIRVQIGIRPSIIRVRQGMVATLGTTGVTGQLYIDLSGGEANAPTLEPNQSIPSIPSLFANLSAELPATLSSINGVLLRLDNAFGEGGQVATIIEDVQALIPLLTRTITDVGSQTMTLLANADDLLDQDTRRLITELTATAKATRQVINRSAPALKQMLESSALTFKQLERQLDDLDLASTNVRAQIAFERFAQLADQLGDTSKEATRTFAQLRSSTTNTEFHLRQAMRGLQETLLSAKQLLDYLEQDPTALLIGKRTPERPQEGP